MQNTINLIELISIVIAAFFGVLGTVTETKSKSTNRLSLWGWIAVIGIILSNSFSFVDSYLKQQKEIAENQQKKEEENKKLQKENTKYQDQLRFQDSVIMKSDTSLSRQMIVQNRTAKLLKELNTSLVIQDSILKSDTSINSTTKKNLEMQTNVIDKQNRLFDLESVTMKNVNRSLFKIDNMGAMAVLSYDITNPSFKNFIHYIYNSSTASIKSGKTFRNKSGVDDNKKISYDYKVVGDSLILLNTLIQDSSEEMKPEEVNLNFFSFMLTFSKKPIVQKTEDDNDLYYMPRILHASKTNINKTAEVNISPNSGIRYSVDFKSKKIYVILWCWDLPKGPANGKIVGIPDLEDCNVGINFWGGDNSLASGSTLESFTLYVGKDQTQLIEFDRRDIKKPDISQAFFSYKIKKENIYK